MLLKCKAVGLLLLGWVRCAGGVCRCRQFEKLSVTKAFTFDAFFVAFGLELFSVFLFFFCGFDHLTFCWFLIFILENSIKHQSNWGEIIIVFIA